MGILDETRQVITYSRELEKKSAALERATTELKAANERLKELDKMKDEFISTVTHELRTPLTSIRSLAEILNDNPDLDKKRQKHFSTIIISETTRLARLINQVLDIQKIESGRMEWQMTRVDMGEIVREAVQTFDQVLNEKEVTLQLDLPGQCPYIHGDRDRLIQVMVNLVSNAIKFCNPKEGLIKISLQTKEDHMRVDIADNGIGIQPENREVIFSKFRQIKDASRGRPQGSGLGLAITRRIISRHGGRIWVDSVPGKGSTFTFTLPMSEYTWSVG
jgi:hypothetical protein